MKDNKLKKPMIIIGIIILVVVIIGVIIFALSSKNKANKTEQTESVEIQKNYEKIANSKEMTFTITLDENNKETIVIKDGQAYKETTRNGVTYKYIVKGNDTYFVDDSNKAYYTYKNNTEISTEIQQKLSKLKEMSSNTGKEKVKGKNYQYEEFEKYQDFLINNKIAVTDLTKAKTRIYYDNDKIVYIKTIAGDEEELLKVAAYAESYSNHPISASIKKAYQKEINQEIIEKTEEISGKGIVSQIENKTVVIGNNKIMQEKGIEYKESNDIGTILYVAINNKFAGSIVIADKIKEDAKQTIQGLKRNNVSKTVMLTGDKKEIAEKVAKQIEIDEVYTDLLPDQKVEKVEELMKQKTEKGKLAFVGDGINDAPVLAISDIGIAMGGLGSDAAIEAADIVIMNDKPSKILEAIKISNKTMRIVKQNIIFAISVKILVLILGACGIATMWEAVFADVGVSFIAILNSLRALGRKSHVI